MKRSTSHLLVACLVAGLLAGCVLPPPLPPPPPIILIPNDDIRKGRQNQNDRKKPFGGEQRTMADHNSEWFTTPQRGPSLTA